MESMTLLSLGTEVLGPCYPLRRSGLSSVFLNLAWPNPDYYRQLVNQQKEEFSLILNTFQTNKNEQKLKGQTHIEAVSAGYQGLAVGRILRC